MITRINEANTLVKHISCKFSSKTCNSNQKWNNATCQHVIVRKSTKKVIGGILAHVFVRMGSI